MTNETFYKAPWIAPCMAPLHCSECGHVHRLHYYVGMRNPTVPGSRCQECKIGILMHTDTSRLLYTLKMWLYAAMALEFGVSGIFIKSIPMFNWGVMLWALAFWGTVAAILTIQNIETTLRKE